MRSSLPCAGGEMCWGERSENLVNKVCGGSLPMFLTAFLSREKLTKEEAEELKRLIDEHTEEG